MKLVELLAREVSEWPCDGPATQDPDKEIRFDHPGHDFYVKDLAEDAGDDYGSGVEVTRAQWQAERDRQNGGEWKRHRGGRKQPIDDGLTIEVKWRDGEIETVLSDRVDWIHYGHDADIMQYRIIRQQQAEEVKVITAEKLEKETVKMFDSYFDACESYKPEANTDQIDGPIKWRDQIVELEAHEEDIRREIANLHKRLTEEGFQLIRQYPNAHDGYPALDLTYWGNWKAGDVVECTESSCDNVYKVGNYYKVAEVTKEYARVADDCGPESYCHISDSEDVTFILSR